MRFQIRDAGDLYEKGRRLAALTLVSIGAVTLHRSGQQSSHWKVDGSRLIGDTSFDRALWWLWEAGYIEPTWSGTPSAFRPTARGHEVLRTALGMTR